MPRLGAKLAAPSNSKAKPVFPPPPPPLLFLFLHLCETEAVWDDGNSTKWYGNQHITSASVSDDVTDLSTGEWDDDGDETGVFQYCTKLKTVRLPKSLRKIGNYAFAGCEILMQVDIPSSSIVLGERSFARCHSLCDVTIPQGVCNLPEGLLSQCSSLKSVKMPSSLKTVGDYAFYKCSSLTTVNFDSLKGVFEIGKYAFSCCSSLKIFEVPPLLKTIKKGAFEECQFLTKVKLPPLLETIEERAFFATDRRPPLCIDLPEAVMNIECEALKECSVSLPTSLSMLTNGGNVNGLFQSAKEVVISCKVNLSLLVDHINGLPHYVNLDPNLKFKILYSSSHTCSTALPTLQQHYPKSFFSFDVSTEELQEIDTQSLQGKVQSAFTNKLSVYAAMLQRKTFLIPKEILYVLLPFIYGDIFAEKQIMLRDFAAQVDQLMASKETKNQTT